MGDDRVWNGDQTDYGLNLTDRPQVLRITMGHYRRAAAVTTGPLHPEGCLARRCPHRR
jgi:hypothetical protein